ncbi:MAG: 3-deoxy-manno-octulosonate cytidylyltransferase [Planctomycetaceae bacterium]|jgi:3-deoxy-manno-octulosonate cytidylyltransferase (CMP-KDO synthetase)|nr:3-deoxy-manno-octulosonate cytidylyltransferase [Planctomycetaceae bacterium]
MENKTKSESKSVVIIPARYASTRLPRKLLLDVKGKPLIQYTYEAALKATLPESVSVACDHREIFEIVEKFGGTVFMTNPNAQSGTDRVAEVAAKMSENEVDIVVNVQGDEPEIAGKSIDLVIRMLIDHPNAVMATLATPIRNQKQLEDPACVKVVFDHTGRALYFSRSVIPYPRNGVTTELLQLEPPLFYQHVGLYAYRRDFLLALSRLPQSDLEKTESLEQLRVLHHGFAIMVGVVNEPTFGIDTPEDYKRFVEKLR